MHKQSHLLCTSNCPSHFSELAVQVCLCRSTCSTPFQCLVVHCDRLPPWHSCLHVTHQVHLLSLQLWIPHLVVPPGQQKWQRYWCETYNEDFILYLLLFTFKIRDNLNFGLKCLCQAKTSIPVFPTNSNFKYLPLLLKQPQLIPLCRVARGRRFGPSLSRTGCLTGGLTIDWSWVRK